MTLSELLTSADSGRLRLYSCCGGQGPSNLTGLDDLVHLVRTYGDRDPIRHLIDTSSSHLELLASIPHRSPFFSGRGFPLRRWLDDFAATAPSSDELALSPFSFPINTLLSLAHYALTAHTIGVDPGQLRDRLHGVIGHSQGVFAAAAIAHSGKGWPAFYNAASLALKLSFWVGLESHLAAPGSTLSAEDAAGCLQHDEGAPSYLLSVTGLSHNHLQRLIRKANTEGVQLSLINSNNKFVLAGTPQALRDICLAIRTVSAPQSLDQTRVPFTQRRPISDVRFLPVSAPYHSSLLASVEPYVVDAIKGLRLNGSDIAIPLYAQVNGKTQNLQDLKEDVLSALIRAVTIEQVDWPDACRKMDSATHVLSFGPGSVGSLVQDVLEGTGVHVMNVSGRSLSSCLNALTSVSSLPVGQNWGRKYRPRLGTSNSKEAEPYIETKMTRLLGLPHVMVAGMTPTTCSPEFVAAVMNAGYHVEFACGGYHHPETLEAALRQLAAAIPFHRSITCNVIYASPKSLTWQINLLHDLIKEGLSIDGLTVGAGIPSPDVVREWVERLDLSHIWFKPGSVDAIDRVLAIARQYPGLPIGLQWTGGRAGGHHSFEDFHQAILDRYSHIRNCDNVILVAGSGFGGGHDTWPYLTGSWSQKLGFAAMPFDGVLLGSRMMVAHEAKTSLAAKQLIVQAPGIVEDDDWTRSQHEAIGGVISVVSEMGQPIHVLATRGMRLWHEFDRRFFSIRDPEQLRVALKKHREEIISRLNRDYARPWFAIADDGRPVEMEDLTYKQVLHRLCGLMFVERHSRWIDPSYLVRVHDFVRLLHARFGTGMSLSNSPAELKVAFDEAYRTHADEVLYPDDAALLLSLFRRQGLKPVPFIPILDEGFETWFKKDSLWQSEDVDSVLEQDAQRVCIIQGPVAVQHSKVCDEPAKDILDGIRDPHTGFLKNQILASGEDDMISAIVQDADVLPGIHVSHDGSICRYQLTGPAIPSSSAILDRLTTGCSWGRAALISKHVLFGRHRVKNPIHDAFQPCIGDIIEIKYASGTPREMTLYHTAVQKSGSDDIRGALEITHLDADTISVALITHSVQTVAGTRPALEFRMKLLGARMGQPVIQIDKETYLDRVRDLYTELWMGPAPCPISAGLNSEFSDGSAVIMAESVKEFLAVISQSGPARSQAWSAQGPVVPLDYAVVLAWTALTKPVLLPALDGDPLQLLHQSISLRLARGVRPLSVGDVVQTASRITEHTITATGQRVEVSAEILRDAQPVVYLRTTFIIQRRTHSASQQFRSVHEQDMVVHVSSPVQLQLLIGRKWLFLDVASHEILGKRLLFRLNTQTVSSAKGTPGSLQVSGLATLLSEQSSTTTTTGAKVGSVYLEEEDHNFNPVMDFLSRHGSPLVQRQPLQSPGWTGDAVIPFTAPSQSSAYARVSKDANPIHTCPLFARFAGRGQPVLHGMHLSATVRRILEWMVGDTERRRFQGWKVSFDGIVRAYDQLRMEVQHRAMEDGLMVVHVKVLNVNTGDQIMHAEAMIEQAPTAYIFTGQGTQEQGMGMGLYGTHKAAQAVWDRAERHFESQYGISLLHLVRDNPKSLAVNFRGKRGQQIRANYLAMRSSSESDKLMLPGLTEASRSYTFSYPSGLLKSTQFAQPALVVMEMAEYAHLQAQGVVQKSALFAGHSLGEYSALGACSTFMQFEPLLSLIFYRGLKMQNALPRDNNGRTQYAMMAVDPSRIGTDFDECSLMDLVQRIARETGLLLEVVNHNVQSRQYVCAGHIRSLWVMGQVCDNLSLATSNSPDTMKECIRHNIPRSQTITSHESLARGIATIPLSGVDIPFHSQMLRGHIDDYRQYLRRHLRVADIKADELVGRWVPNVVGKPFTLEISYIRLVQQITQSRALHGLLEQVGERL